MEIPLRFFITTLTHLPVYKFDMVFYKNPVYIINEDITLRIFKYLFRFSILDLRYRTAIILIGGEPMRTEYSDDVTIRSSSIFLDHGTIKGKS